MGPDNSQTPQMQTAPSQQTQNQQSTAQLAPEAAGGTVLPRALADTINEGLSLHGPDDGPVTVVNVITLDTRDIESIEREFGGQRGHAKEVPFDLFAAPSSPPSPISGSVQPATQAPPTTGQSPE
jgi:hypothetical protein